MKIYVNMYKEVQCHIAHIIIAKAMNEVHKDCLLAASETATIHILRTLLSGEFY